VSLLILSAATRVRTPAPLNHRAYADRLGVDYVFDMTPGPLPTALDQKLAAVRRVLPLYEWVFWIDDDAFFTNLDVDIRSFADDDADLILCASPVNPEGGWTFVSFGQFLIRRTPAMLDLLETVAATDLDAVKEWWEPERYGIFTNTDQDALVYNLTRDDVPWAGRWRRLEWQAFNSRPYHYQRSLDEHALCHFVVPGALSKMDLVREFADRMGTTTALVDAAQLEPYAAFIAQSDLAELLGPPWATPVPEHPPGIVDSPPAAAGPAWRRAIRRLVRSDPS
jgi:hypothetical protein